MERYGGVQAKEESSADPVAEWSSPEGETGLEEPMWQLGLGGGDGGGGGGDDSYPERPDEADCIYYLRTGYCGFGSSCRFNHPRDRSAVVGAMRATGGEYPERAGQPVCQYYMRTGMCKFGVSCKYHHPRQGGGSVSSAAISISGYPLRPGEKECSYYLKTGQCKFGITCKFHHPPPTGIHMPGPGPLPAAAAAVPSAIYPTVQPPGPSSQQYGVVAGNWPVARPALLPGSYIQGTYGPVILPPGMVPLPGWNPYQAALSPVASPSAQTSVGAGPIYGMSQLSSAAPAYGGPYLSPSPAGPSAFNQKEHAFPERPGQPECQYYMKTGDCKFGSSCRYHHPPRWSVPKTNFVLSVMGLPLRPGAQLCSHYAQNGVCKYGPTCKFDHPMSMLSYSPSTSSLTDMAVAPYPVGYSIATLAPASLSSDLRPEILGSSKEVLSTRMPTSVSTPAGSVGSIFSRNTPLPHSSVQQPGQSSPPSTGSSGTPHVSEVRTSG